MPDVPPVTIVDPGGAGRHLDVLDGGEPREPRVPGRWKAAGLVVVVLVTGGVLSGRAYVEDRAEQRVRDAAFAVADEVHVRGVLGAVHALDPVTGPALSATVQVSTPNGNLGGNRIVDLRLEGEGMVPRTPDLSGLAESPTTARAESQVDCDRVAAGRYPEQGVVVLDVVPRSGVTHSQRMPVGASILREGSLQACDLPDPDARARVEVQGAPDGWLWLFLEPVQRSGSGLAVEQVTVPGFEVRPFPGTPLPMVVPPGTGALYALVPRVTDCAVAGGSSEVSVRLQVGDVREVRIASAAVSQPQPGGVPTTQLLQRIVDASC